MEEKVGVIEKIRRWIDVENNLHQANLVIETALQKIEKSENDIFFDKLLEKINEVLKKKIVRDSTETFVPSRFIVYLSFEKEKELRKDEREYFERQLGKLMLKIAKTEAKDSPLSTNEIKVFIKIDGTLAKAEIRVRYLTQLA